MLLKAFLQRIVNGGDRVEREYGLGHKRTDILITWPTAGEVQRVVLELKLVRGALETISRRRSAHPCATIVLKQSRFINLASSI